MADTIYLTLNLLETLHQTNRQNACGDCICGQSELVAFKHNVQPAGNTSGSSNMIICILCTTSVSGDHHVAGRGHTNPPE